MQCPFCEGPVSERSHGPVGEATLRLECRDCHGRWSTQEELARFVAARREPPPGSRLSYVFEENGSHHDDLVLRIDEFTRRSDSYFHLLDRGPSGPDSGSEEGAARVDVRASIAGLLEQWRLRVARATGGQVVYLLHDLSDEYSGWIECRGLGERFVLTPGVSRTPGFGLRPSDRSESWGRQHDVVPWQGVAPMVFSRAALLADIDASIEWHRRGAGGRAAG